MLNEEKVRLMAKAEAYEQTEGKETIKNNQYFEQGDSYIVFLRNIPMGIITFLLFAAVIYAGVNDGIKNLYRSIGPVLSLIIAIIIFVLFVVAYALFSRYMQKKEYDNNRGTFFKYGFNKEKIKGYIEKADNF